MNKETIKACLLKFSMISFQQASFHLVQLWVSTWESPSPLALSWEPWYCTRQTESSSVMLKTQQRSETSSTASTDRDLSRTSREKRSSSSCSLRYCVHLNYSNISRVRVSERIWSLSLPLREVHQKQLLKLELSLQITQDENVSDVLNSLLEFHQL